MLQIMHGKRLGHYYCADPDVHFVKGDYLGDVT